MASIKKTTVLVTQSVPSEKRRRVGNWGMGEKIVKRLAATMVNTPSRIEPIREFVEKERVQSSLGMLLRFEDLRVGVLFLNYRTPHRFSSDELATVHLFAHQAAIAIRNAQLYQEAEKRQERLETLVTVAQRLTRGLDLPTILNAAAISDPMNPPPITRNCSLRSLNVRSR